MMCNLRSSIKNENFENIAPLHGFSMFFSILLLFQVAKVDHVFFCCKLIHFFCRVYTTVCFCRNVHCRNACVLIIRFFIFFFFNGKSAIVFLRAYLGRR